MTKTHLLVIIIGIFLVFSGISYYNLTSRNAVTTNRDYPTIQNFNFYSINEIKQKGLAIGTYNTEGYVVKIYECPRCPQWALCKACMGNNIVISQNNKILDEYTLLTNNEIILFTNNPRQFELGKKYSFSINILDYKSTDEPINDIEIIGYR